MNGIYGIRAARATGVSGPVQDALSDHPYVTDEQKRKENTSLGDAEPTPLVVANGPGKQKQGLYVEDDKEHGNQEEAHGVAGTRLGDGFDAAFIC